MSFINLHHLRLFRAVARESSLTGAARSLNISQSAVSTQIKTLEQSLGHDLFERRGRSLHLTEAGRIALDHADEIFRTADHLAATLTTTQAQRRVLRIGALATLSRNFQMQFLQPLMDRDNVEVVLRSGSQEDLLRGLQALSLDVVLTNLAPARDATSPYLLHRLDQQGVSLVGTPQRAAAISAANIDAASDTSAIEQVLSTQPLILPTPETSLRAGFDAMLNRLGVVPKIAAEADDMAMIRLLARADCGLAVIPPIVVRDELASGLLTECVKLPEISEVFYAVTIKRRFTNSLLDALLK